MNNYLQDKGKLKAIATYTFRNLTTGDNRHILTKQIVDILKATLLRYSSDLNDMQIEDLVESIDRSHKGSLNLDQFVELFEKAFQKVWDELQFKKNVK